MRQLLVTAVLAAAALACGKSSSPGYTTAAGSLALSRDGSFLYAVDSDNGIVAVVDTHQLSVVTTVNVGVAPERVVVGPDDTLYISNRGERSVSFVQPGTWKETARVAVGVEPVGLAVSANGKTLYVVNSTALDSPAQGSVMAIDTASRQIVWEQKVGEEPRGIRLIDGHTAAVTLLKKGDIAFLNLDGAGKAPTVLGSDPGEGLYSQINTQGSSLAFSTFHTRGFNDVAISPDGARIYAPGVFAREDAIAFPPNVVDGYYNEGGPCNLGAIATPGLVTVDAQSQQPQVDDLTSCSFSNNSANKDFPPTTLGPPATIAGHTTPIQGSYVSIVDQTNSWIYLVNRESNNVAILPTSRRDGPGISFDATGSSIRDLIQVGRAPNGIALAADGKTAYVYNQFDHTLSVLIEDRTQSPSIIREMTDNAGVPLRLQVTSDPPSISAQVLAGRRLFFDATDGRMNNPATGVSCASCHTEGREDGHVWFFPDGKRQTPSLAGRMMLQTAPFHWTGQFADFNSFLDHTVQARMGGSGLGNTERAEVAAFIDSLQAPDNPMRLQTMTDAEQRGAQVFAAANCGSCHGGPAMTNNGFADVHTAEQGVDIAPNGFNVPSLLGLGRTAPYLHDGSAVTLKDRLNASLGTNNHGNLANVTSSQVDDLVAYLQSL
jgi:YVTN family beta-propeller protein